MPDTVNSHPTNHDNTNSIDHFLNVVEAKKWGHDKLKSWLNVRALDIVLMRVTKEMDSLHVFQMSIKDLTPEFLMGFKLQLAITEVNHLFIWSEMILRMSRQKHEEKSASFGEKHIVWSETIEQRIVYVY